MNLELLLKSYTELVTLWSKMSPGESCSRVWAASRFLEKLIKKEIEK